MKIPDENHIFKNIKDLKKIVSLIQVAVLLKSSNCMLTADLDSESAYSKVVI